MQSHRSLMRAQVVVRFEASDRRGELTRRFSAAEWRGIPELAVDERHVSSARLGLNERLLTGLVEDHIDAYERRCFLLRPGGWDANGAPV